MRKCKFCKKIIISSRPISTARKFCNSTCEHKWKYHNIASFRKKQIRVTKKYLKEHPIKAREWNRKALDKFRKEKPDRFNELIFSWRRKNPEKYAAIQKRYRLKNLDKFREYAVRAYEKKKLEARRK